MVDDVVGPKEIAKVFAQKFDELYNCVSYDSDEMDVLLTTIHKSIDNKCTRTCVHGSHSISAKDVNKAICKLGKSIVKPVGEVICIRKFPNFSDDTLTNQMLVCNVDV